MRSKALEIRDVATFIPVLAVNMNPSSDASDYAEYKAQVDAQHYLLRRCGYPCDGRPNVLLTELSADGGRAWNDPYAWGGRTYPVAHLYIIEHWDELADGDVVDVEFILGESTVKKVSEREES